MKVLLTSDRHLDSPDTDRAMQRRHLQEALDGNWPVVDLGDVFDAMQGRFDPRRMPSDLIPELQGRDDYVSGLVEYAADFLGPYASVLAVIGRGNHESTVNRINGVDLLSGLVYRLRSQNPDCNAHVGGYGGWLLIQIEDHTGNGRPWAVTKAIKYFHGNSGSGGGMMTKGTLSVVRRSAIYPDADAIVSGHIHENWSMEIGRERLSRQGRPHQDACLHVSAPSYKDEYKDGRGGWAVERGMPPKTIGAVWLTLTMRSERMGKTHNIYRADLDAVRAR